MKKLKILLPLVLFLLLTVIFTTRVNAAPTVTNVNDLANWINSFGGGGSAIVSGNKVTLQKNITATESMYLYTSGGNNLILDLNGHYIDFNLSGTNGAIWGSTIADFTITDSSGKDTDYIITNKGPVIYNSASKNTFVVENTSLITSWSSEDPAFKSYGTNTNIFNNVTLKSYTGGIVAQGWDKFILNNVTFNLGDPGCKYGVKIYGHNEVTLNNCKYKSSVGDGNIIWSTSNDAKATINGGSYEYNYNGSDSSIKYLMKMENGTLEVNSGNFYAKESPVIRGVEGNIIINDGTFNGKSNALLIANGCNLALKGGNFIARNTNGSNYGAVAFSSSKKIYNIIPYGYFSTNDIIQKNSVTQYNETVKEFKVLAIPQDIYLLNEKFTYNKKVQKPTVDALDYNGRVIPGSSYTVEYAGGCKKIGTYFVYVTFTGDYASIGQVELTYQIVPKGTKISKLKAGKKSFTASWKKQATETTGYQVQYSTSKSFSSGVKTINIKKNKTTSTTKKKLKAKKKYYVRVRTYKTVSGMKYYSSWSASKTVKTKK